VTTDYRALCAELAKILAEEYGVETKYENGDPLEGGVLDVLACARAALARPEPQGATDEEIDALLPLGMASYSTLCGPREIRAFARAVLQRFGRLAITPIPLSERLPGDGDCDAHGWCWVLYSPYATWTLEPPLDANRQPCGWSHWLPHHALPLPSPNCPQQP